MDERVREHAAVLVDWSARVEAGDDVVVAIGEGAHDLGVAVVEELGAIGANPVTTYSSAEVTRAYLRAHGGDVDAAPAHQLALYENADAVLMLRGSHNTTGAADVPPDIRHDWPTQTVRDALYSSDWVATLHPTRAHAQQAGMAFEPYREFVYDAILRDWESLASEMAQLKDLLDDGSEVRLVKGDSDLVLSIDERTAVNSAASVAYDSHNLPSGEVFTAPTATEGEVHFDVPMTHDGTRIRDVHLTFEDGVVVEHSAAIGEDALDALLDTDEGARRLGELGIGMNRGIDRFTDNILFDEKMGGTVHLALGRAYDACLPEGEQGNESAVHADLITDMRADGTHLAIDGEVVQRDGHFRWEDGFDG